MSYQQDTVQVHSASVAVLCQWASGQPIMQWGRRFAYHFISGCALSGTFLYHFISGCALSGRFLCHFISGCALSGRFLYDFISGSALSGSSEPVLQVCDQLGVPLETVPMTDQYWRHVVGHCVAEIKQGRTPNPDVLCNARVKFGSFLDYLEQQGSHGFDRIASGHYAR
jgi:tRNA methyl transferase